MTDVDLSFIPEKYLLCKDRSIGHDWDVRDGFKLSRKSAEFHGSEITRGARCAHCGTERVEFFDHVGPGGYIQRVGKPRYTYPRDWQWPAGTRSNDIHSELYRRSRRAQRKAKVAS